MKRSVGLAGLALLLVVGSAAPAQGGRVSSTYVSITRVEPVFVASGVDDYGTWCEYEAQVTLSWSGSIQLWVSQFVDGRRQAPGELALKGSGTDATVVVKGIGVREGAVGPLVAEAQVLARKAWKVIDAEASATAVTCPAPG